MTLIVSGIIFITLFLGLFIGWVCSTFVDRVEQRMLNNAWEREKFK